jgi:hypothetical protein
VHSLPGAHEFIPIYDPTVPKVQATLTMPLNILATGFFEGFDRVPFGWTAIKVIPCLAIVYLLKWYFNGAVNTSERNMHSKVVIITVRSESRI